MPTFETTAPTAQQVYDQSRLRWQKLGYPDPSAIVEPLTAAIAYITTVTGRYYSDWDPPASVGDGAAGLVATPNLIPLANRAVRMRTEQTVMQDRPSYVDTVSEDMIQSFSAGPYSESHRDPTRRGEEKTLNTWPILNDLLWTLMTEERYGFWLSFISGAHVPAFQVEEVVWDLVGKDFAGFGLASGMNPIAPTTMWS